LGVLTNTAAIYAENNLNQTQSSLQNTLTQLSSGSRINSGSDDAAGLSVVDGLQANVSALTQSSQNASDGIGLLQTADGALSQVTNLLNRAVTLSTEAANGTLNTNQVSSANAEYQNILTEIGNIGSTTNFNGNSVFSSTAKTVFVSDGTASGATSFSETVGALSASTVGEGVGTTNVTVTTPGIATSLANPASTNSAVGGGATTALTTGTEVDAVTTNPLVNNTTAPTTGTAVVTGSGATQAASVTITPPASDGLGGSISFANAGAAVGGTGAVAVAFGAGENIAAQVTTANAAFAAAATANGGVSTGLTATANGNNLVISSAQGAGSGVAVSANTLVDSVPTSTTVPSTLTFTPAAKGNQFTGTIDVGAIGTTNGTSAIQLVLTGPTTAASVVSQLNTAFTAAKLGSGANQPVASVNSTTGAVVITGPAVSGQNLSATGSTVSSTAGTASTATFAPTGATDTLSGTLSVAVGSGAASTLTIAANSTLTGVAAAINASNSSFTAAGISASVNASNQLTLTGPAGASSNLVLTGTSLVDTTAAVSTVSTPPTAGVSFASGASTDVSQLTASTASTVLTSVTTAIGDVAYQRGIIGADVNELTAASNVASAESVNLTSAQSSIQSTDYGAATSNLAKYQVLSQTGISALAQANSVQQEVLKLLQ
jgi:flagellin